MTFNREYRLAFRICKIHLERNPALHLPLPFDNADEHHPILPRRKVGGEQFVEYAMNIHLAVRPRSGIRTKKEYCLHQSTPHLGLGPI